MRGFQNFHNIEDVFFSISDLPLKTMYVLAPVIIEHIFDTKTFDSEKLEKLTEYYCDLVNWFLKSGIFPECEKFTFVSDPGVLASYRPLYYTSFLSKVMEYACLQ